ncbi:MAG: type II toxin-antitoxin system VapC family toxin, partial [Candidatus Binatia bacterium]
PGAPRLGTVGRESGRDATRAHWASWSAGVTLVDSSAWIEVFRKAKPLDLSAYVAFDDIVTCLPVIQEVLQGFRDERAYRGAREAMFSLPLVESPMRADLIEDAVGLYRAARRQGVTIRSSVDCLIAACAIRHDLEVLHRDRDYTQISRVSALRARTL